MVHTGGNKEPKKQDQLALQTPKVALTVSSLEDARTLKEGEVFCKDTNAHNDPKIEGRCYLISGPSESLLLIEKKTNGVAEGTPMAYAVKFGYENFSATSTRDVGLHQVYEACRLVTSKTPAINPNCSIMIGFKVAALTSKETKYNGFKEALSYVNLTSSVAKLDEIFSVYFAGEKITLDVPENEIKLNEYVLISKKPLVALQVRKMVLDDDVDTTCAGDDLSDVNVSRYDKILPAGTKFCLLSPSMLQNIDSAKISDAISVYFGNAFIGIQVQKPRPPTVLEVKTIGEALKLANSFTGCNEKPAAKGKKIQGSCYLLSGPSNSLLLIQAKEDAINEKPEAYRVKFGYKNFFETKNLNVELHQVYEACRLVTSKTSDKKPNCNVEIGFKAGILTSVETEVNKFRQALTNAKLTAKVANLDEIFSGTEAEGKITLSVASNTKIEPNKYVLISEEPLIALQLRENSTGDKKPDTICAGDDQSDVAVPNFNGLPKNTKFCFSNSTKVKGEMFLLNSDAVRVGFGKTFEGIVYEKLRENTFITKNNLPQNAIYDGLISGSALTECNAPDNVKNLESLRSVVVISFGEMTVFIENDEAKFYSIVLDENLQIQTFYDIFAAVRLSASKTKVSANCQVKLGLNVVDLTDVLAKFGVINVLNKIANSVADGASVTLESKNVVENLFTTLYEPEKIRVDIRNIDKCPEEGAYYDISGLPDQQVKCFTKAEQNCPKKSFEIIQGAGAPVNRKLCLVKKLAGQKPEEDKLTLDLKQYFDSVKTKVLKNQATEKPFSNVAEQFPAEAVPNDFKHASLKDEKKRKICKAKIDPVEGRCKLLSSATDSLLFVKVGNNKLTKVYSLTFGYDTTGDDLKKNMQDVYTACRLTTSKMQHVTGKCSIKLGFSVAFVEEPSDDAKTKFLVALKKDSVDATMVKSDIGAGLDKLFANEPAKGKIGVKGLILNGQCIKDSIFKVSQSPAIALKCVGGGKCKELGGTAFGNGLTYNEICLLPLNHKDQSAHTGAENTIDLNFDKFFEEITPSEISAASVSASLVPIFCALLFLLVVAQRYI